MKKLISTVAVALMVTLGCTGKDGVMGPAGPAGNNGNIGDKGPQGNPAQITEVTGTTTVSVSGNIVYQVNLPFGVLGTSSVVLVYIKISNGVSGDTSWSALDQTTNGTSLGYFIIDYTRNAVMLGNIVSGTAYRILIVNGGSIASAKSQGVRK